MAKNVEKPKSDNLRLVLGGCLIIVLILIIVLQNLSDDGTTVLYSEEDIIAERRLLRQQQVELQKRLDDVERSRLTREAFAKRGGQYWLVKRDGQPEGNVQKIIEKVAAQVGFKFSTLGSLRNKKVVDGVVSYEVTVAAESSMEALVQFLDALEQVKPRFYWQNCRIGPKTPQGSDEVRLTGVLSFVSLEDEALLKLVASEQSSQK